MATSTRGPRRAQQRVIVTGQFRVMVEAISRALPPAAGATPVVLDSCTSTNAARDLLMRRRATLVVLILSPLDVLYAPDLVAALVGRGREVAVVGELSDPHVAHELAAAGAIVAPEADSIRALVRLVDRRLNGEPAPAGRSTAAARSRPAGAGPTEEQRARSNLARLTPAEARTLWRLMHGCSVAEIAQLHFVSVETVRSHIRSLLSKLEASSQLSAVALAWHVGWRPTLAALAAA